MRRSFLILAPWTLFQPIHCRLMVGPFLSWCAVRHADQANAVPRAQPHSRPLFQAIIIYFAVSNAHILSPANRFHFPISGSGSVSKGSPAPGLSFFISKYHHALPLTYFLYFPLGEDIATQNLLLYHHQ